MKPTAPKGKKNQVRTPKLEVNNNQPERGHILTTPELMAISTDATGHEIADNFFVGKTMGDNSKDPEDPENTESVFVPELKNIKKCYRHDFTLKTKKEAKQIRRKKKIVLSREDKKADFFVYNQRTHEMKPFTKGDYLMYDGGHITFDGKSYISYDNGGNEVGRFSYASKEELQ